MWCTLHTKSGICAPLHHLMVRMWRNIDITNYTWSTIKSFIPSVFPNSTIFYLRDLTIHLPEQRPLLRHPPPHWSRAPAAADLSLSLSLSLSLHIGHLAQQLLRVNTGMGRAVWREEGRWPHCSGCGHGWVVASWSRLAVEWWLVCRGAIMGNCDVWRRRRLVCTWWRLGLRVWWHWRVAVVTVVWG